jgi:hypothetical protein
VLPLMPHWGAAAWAQTFLDDPSPGVRSTAAGSVVDMAESIYEEEPVKTVRLLDRITKRSLSERGVSKQAAKVHRNLLALATRQGLLDEIMAVDEDAGDDLGLDLGL